MKAVLQDKFTMSQSIPWVSVARLKGSYQNDYVGCIQSYFAQSLNKKLSLCKWSDKRSNSLANMNFLLSQSRNFRRDSKQRVYDTFKRQKSVHAAYSSGSGYPVSNKYKRVGGCLVIPPPSGQKPRAILKFLGGAFIGAVPEAFYSLFMELLAKEGFLVIAVPYNVTFDHEQAAKEVYNKFNDCIDVLSASGLPFADLAPNDIKDLPVCCIGHSNGALLQSLEACYFEEKLQKANVLIAFNNKPAADAVPYFEQVGPAAAQLAPVFGAFPFMEMATTSGDALRGMLQTVGPMLQQYDPEMISSFAKFSEQLPSVMNQITEGTSEFKPTPSENQQTIQSSYKAPKTLLVKFNFDTIDETDRLEEVLKSRVDAIGGSLTKVALNGTHVTPCGQDLKWEVGDVYTPADAVAQGLRGAALNDVRTLVRTIVQWIDNAL